MPSLIVGGGFWKGADVIVSALKARSDAVATQRRLDFEQMQANYDNAMDLIDKQAKRIDALTTKVELYEKRIDALNIEINLQRDQRANNEMTYAKEIKALHTQIEQLQQENETLRAELTKTQCDYERALERIEKLEKSGDTGPLKER